MNTKVVFCHASTKSFTYRPLPLPVAYELNELRNPISNIYLASDMLDGTSLDEEQRKCLEIIMRGATRIMDMVSKMLIFPVTGEPVNGFYTIRRLLEEVVMAAEGQLLRKQIEISVHYSAVDNMDNRIWPDAFETRIALTNIIDHAIDDLPSGGELVVFAGSVGDTSTIEIHTRSRSIVA